MTKKGKDHLIGEWVAARGEKSSQVIEERSVAAENSNPTNKVMRVSCNEEPIFVSTRKIKMK